MYNYNFVYIEKHTLDKVHDIVCETCEYKCHIHVNLIMFDAF